MARLFAHAAPPVDCLYVDRSIIHYSDVATRQSGHWSTIYRKRTKLAESKVSDVLAGKEGGSRDVLGGGEAQETGQVLAVWEATRIWDLRDDGQGVADTGAVDGPHERCFGAVFDAMVARLEVVSLALLQTGDVLPQVDDPLADRVALTGAGIAPSATLNEGLCFSTAQFAPAGSLDFLYASGDEVFGEDVALEQVLGWCAPELGSWRSPVEGRIKGAD